jgi:membrane-associated protease RseP (regulator of RpoE activity)
VTSASIRWTSILGLIAAIALACPSDGFADKPPKDESKGKVEDQDSNRETEAEKAEESPARFRAKIVVLGPDGKKKEFNIGPEGTDGDVEIELDGVPERIQELWEGRVPSGFGPIAIGQPAGKYMIGLHCTPVPDALRAHLDLPERAGLLVRHVMPKSPAAKAGIAQHDVLVQAGDTELKSVGDLMEAVRKAKTQPFTVSVIRKGKQRKVELTPVERSEAVDINVGAKMPFDLEQLRRRLRESGVELPDDLPAMRVPFGDGDGGIIVDVPGMIDGGEAAERLEKDLEELREQVEQLRKSLRKLQKQQDGETSNPE